MNPCPMWLGFLNFILLQWFFYRLGVNIEDDKRVGWCAVGPCLPLTGWWGFDYIWLRKRKTTKERRT